MANASITSMLDVTGGSKKLDKSFTGSGGVDDSFAKLFDQAQQDVTKPKSAVPEKNDNGPSRAAQVTTQQTNKQTDKKVSGEEVAEKDESVNVSASDENQAISNESSENEDQLADDGEATAQTAETADDEVTEEVDVTGQPVVAVETQQVDDGTKTSEADTAEIVAANPAEDAGIKEQALDEALNTKVSQTAEAIRAERQEVLKNSMHVLPSLAMMQATGGKENNGEKEGNNPLINALFHNNLPKGAMEALARLYGDKSVKPEQAQQEKFNLQDIPNIQELLDGNLDLDKDAFNALEHISADKLKTIVNAAQLANTEGAVSSRSIIDQLISQNGDMGLGSVLSNTAPLNPGLFRIGANPLQPSTPGTNMFLPPQLEDATWGNEFAKRISFMARGQLQNAEIRLNPPDLGHIAVRINLNQESAHINFAAQHANVRDAIEAALPRLRELLSESGLQLGNVNVSTQSEQQHQQARDGHQAQGDVRLSGAVLPGDDEFTSVEGGGHVSRVTDRLVDYFA